MQMMTEYANIWVADTRQVSSCKQQRRNAIALDNALPKGYWYFLYYYSVASAFQIPVRYTFKENSFFFC